MAPIATKSTLRLAFFRVLVDEKFLLLISGDTLFLLLIVISPSLVCYLAVKAT